MGEKPAESESPPGAPAPGAARSGAHAGTDAQPRQSTPPARTPDPELDWPGV